MELSTAPDLGAFGWLWRPDFLVGEEDYTG